MGRKAPSNENGAGAGPRARAAHVLGPLVLVAAADESWRVRERQQKVTARDLVDDGHEVVKALLTDPVP